MMRTSTRRGLVSPSGVNSRSWMTRSRRTCVSGGMSPISSRKIEPPSATSNKPFFAAMAPVKAPRVCPKSSDSSSSVGMFELFTVTKGFVTRGLASWIAFAINSLPVPLSPVIRIVDRAAATCSTTRKTSCMMSERPTIAPRSTSRLIACRSDRRSSSLRRRLTPVATVALICSFWKGLRMQPKAPFSQAAIAVSKVA